MRARATSARGDERRRCMKQKKKRKGKKKPFSRERQGSRRCETVKRRTVRRLYGRRRATEQKTSATLNIYIKKS